MAKTPILLSTAALALRRTRIGTRLSSHVYQTDLESDLAPVGMLDQSCQGGLFYVGIEIDQACQNDNHSHYPTEVRAVQSGRFFLFWDLTGSI